MQLNKSPLNKISLNETLSEVIATGSGLIVEMEQKIGVYGQGTLVSFEQDVVLYQAGEGLIVSFEQNVRNVQSGVIIYFEQKVKSAVANTFYNRNGYDCDIYIGGYQVPKEQIHGNIIIQKQENKSGGLQFTIIPPLGIQNPEQFQGKAVYVNITDPTGTYRIFTGFVDTPSIDLIDKKITFDCSDRRDSRILDMDAGYIDTIGKYSVDVFGQAKDQADELEKRLSTVPACLDFDNYGIAQYTDWAPKALADFTLDSSDIYYDRPNVVYTNRTKTLNTVNLNIRYHFQRLHQQLVNISWPGYQDFLVDWFNQGTPSFPTKDMIQSAAFDADWKPVTRLNLVNLWPAGGFGNVSWQPNQVTHEYKERTETIFLPYNPAPGVFSATWPDGKKYPLESPVLDSFGKKIYDIISTTIIDTSSMLCRGASWTAGLKFSQNVVYGFNIQVVSPQAINKYGMITDTITIDVNDDYDTSLWERDSRTYYSATNFYQDKRARWIDLQKAIDCAIRKARTSIQGAHRDASVNFRHTIWPQVDLKHTVELITTPVSCKGKVASITHTINIGTGEAYTDTTLLLSRSNGGDTASSLLINIPVDDSSYIGSTPQSIVLGTHVGLDPDPTVTKGAEKWNGFIGNKTITSTTAANMRTQFTESFVVDYPAIPATLRDDRELEAATTLTIVVPNDTLEVEF